MITHSSKCYLYFGKLTIQIMQVYMEMMVWQSFKTGGQNAEKMKKISEKP